MSSQTSTKLNNQIAKWIDECSTKRKKEAMILLHLMQQLTHEEPIAYPSNIIGFGFLPKTKSNDNKYPFLIGFAARKSKIAIYLSPQTNKKVFDQLGKHTKGVNCLYINQLEDVDLIELEDILRESIEELMSL